MLSWLRCVLQPMSCRSISVSYHRRRQGRGSWWSGKECWCSTAQRILRYSTRLTRPQQSGRPVHVVHVCVEVMSSLLPPLITVLPRRRWLTAVTSTWPPVRLCHRHEEPVFHATPESAHCSPASLASTQPVDLHVVDVGLHQNLPLTSTASLLLLLLPWQRVVSMLVCMMQFPHQVHVLLHRLHCVIYLGQWERHVIQWERHVVH